MRYQVKLCGGPVYENASYEVIDTEAHPNQRIVCRADKAHADLVADRLNRLNPKE